MDITPVSDVDRSKEFYQRLRWRLDDDVAPIDGLRIVVFTPPGSGCQITFGHGLTTAAAGELADQSVKNFNPSSSEGTVVSGAPHAIRSHRWINA